jgi:hypothetical protein
MAKEPKASPAMTRKRSATPKRAGQAETGKERRRAPRVNVNLPARWEGDLGQQQANVTSLSKLGCFVLSGGQVRPKELIRLEIWLNDEAEAIVQWGAVVEVADEIGFALHFTSSEEADQVLLDQFPQLYLTSPT